MIVPIELIAELRRVQQEKKYLREHISQEALDHLISALQEHGEIPEQIEELEPLSRDAKVMYACCL